MEFQFNKTKLIVEVGDITQVKVMAIVNAANNSLLGGGGVDGAIHRAAGPELLRECQEIGGCPTGEARLTKGYNLYANWIIHTVGPVYAGGNGNEEELLSNAYKSSLEMAVKNGIVTIAFPAISTGVYGYPLKLAAEVSIFTIFSFCQKNPGINEVRIILFSQGYYDIYKNIMSDIIKKRPENRP